MNRFQLRSTCGFAILGLALTLATTPFGRTEQPPPGRGKGPNPAMRADQAVFHYLLENHKDIRRTVKEVANGVETLTESDRPEVAKKIQDHAHAMHQRVKDGNGLRYWDELFAAIFQRTAKIAMTVENTEKGVRVKETSEDPAVVSLIQAHAKVVSRFVEIGFEEAHKNHPVPAAKPRP